MYLNKVATVALIKLHNYYRKSGNFHVKIIHVVNICQFIFMGLWYPRKYFNMNLFSTRTFSYNHCTCIVDIAHEY